MMYDFHENDTDLWDRAKWERALRNLKGEAGTSGTNDEEGDSVQNVRVEDEDIEGS